MTEATWNKVSKVARLSWTWVGSCWHTKRPSQSAVHSIDEKIIPPAQTSCNAGARLQTLTEKDQAERIWVGNFKTRSCFWVRERICITHSLFDGLSHVSLDSPFCGCVWICFIFFFFEKVQAMCELVLQQCWPMRGQSVSCSKWKHMEYRWLLGCQGIGWVPGWLALQWRFILNWLIFQDKQYISLQLQNIKHYNNVTILNTCIFHVITDCECCKNDLVHLFH